MNALRIAAVADRSVLSVAKLVISRVNVRISLRIKSVVILARALVISVAIARQTIRITVTTRIRTTGRVEREV